MILKNLVLKILIIIIILLPGCLSPENRKPDKIKKNPAEAKILFGGDVMLDWGIKDTINKEGITYPLKFLKNFLHTFDYRFCNLECPISDPGEVHPEKKYIFQGNPGHIELLKYAEINCVSLANNHALDLGKTGLLNTIEILTKNNISVIGAGNDIGAAHLPAAINIKGIRMAILAYADAAYEASPAEKDIPGIAVAKVEQITEDIKQYRSFYDFIIISIHWANEYYEYPSEKEIKLGHQIIESGADAVIGHHPHIFQGIEIYNNKPIFYSLGNFIFGSVNEDARENILLQISFFDNRIKSFSVFPINGNGNSKTPFQYRIIDGNHAANTLNHLINISKPLNSDFSQNAVINGSSLVYSFDNN